MKYKWRSAPTASSAGNCSSARAWTCDHIGAIYHDGVLTVTIPVAEQAKPHKIEVTHVGSVAQAVEAASSAIRAEGEASNGSPMLVGPPG